MSQLSAYVREQRGVEATVGRRPRTDDDGTPPPNAIAGSVVITQFNLAGVLGIHQGPLRPLQWLRIYVPETHGNGGHD